MTSHTRKLVCSFLLLTSLALSPPLLAATAHEHPQTEDQAKKLTLNNGKKWVTDDVVRKGMAEIRAMMADNTERSHKGKMKAAEYKTLGATIETRVTAFVEQCKLEPKADAMFHIVLADLHSGAHLMQEKNQGKAGAHKVVRALDAYGLYFEHAGWKALK